MPLMSHRAISSKNSVVFLRLIIANQFRYLFHGWKTKWVRCVSLERGVLMKLEIESSVLLTQEKFV